MKKLLPSFLLFLSLLSLVSCTITKRKYTGGFYVNWHQKALETVRPHPTLSYDEREKSQPYCTPEVAHSTTSPEKIVTKQKTEKAANPKLAKDFKASPKEITKNVSDNPAVADTYTVTPENTVPGHDTPAKDTSVRNVISALISYLLAVVIAAGLFLYIAMGAVTALYILFLIPFTLCIISLTYCSRAMKDGHNRGLIVLIIFNVLDLLFLLFLMLFSL